MTRAILKAIVPGHVPRTEDYIRAIEQAFDKTFNLIERDFNSTVKTWDHKPDFRTVVSRGKNFSQTYGTDNLIYHFVDHGTKPHVIEAKRSRFLVFQGGYSAKTRVGIIGSRPGGSSGDTQFAMRVNHPGFPGRKFVATIKKRREVTMRQEIEHGIAKVNRTQR
jgi:hypothetical protein